MAFQVLSADEVSRRMRDVVSRAAAMQASLDGVARNPTAALRGPDLIAGLRPSALDASSGQERLDFQVVLRDALRGVSDAQNAAQAKAQAYQLGDDKTTLEDVMISLQRANLAMQGMVQVRNKLVEAYREVMNMQV
jgi:flagellar hook-basal body complex protein FliE